MTAEPKEMTTNFLKVKILRRNSPAEHVTLSSKLLRPENMYHALRLKYMLMGIPHDITPSDDYSSVTVNLLEPMSWKSIALGNTRSQSAMELLDALRKAWLVSVVDPRTADDMYGEAFSIMLSLSITPVIINSDTKRVGNFILGPTMLISSN